MGLRCIQVTVPRIRRVGEQNAIMPFLIALAASTICSAIRRQKLIGRDTDGHMEVRRNTDKLAARRDVLHHFQIIECLEVLLIIDHLNSDEHRERAKSHNQAVVKVFPLCFREFHFIPPSRKVTLAVFVDTKMSTTLYERGNNIRAAPLAN